MTARWMVAVTLLLAACSRDERPNVVLITLDTTRADRVGAMGHADARTPVLDALAARGVVFERAYASVPLTLPSHATMLTGLEPYRHHLHDNGRRALPADVPTVAERLATSGYDTAAFVAAFVLDSTFGLDRGFARYDDDIAPQRDPLRQEVPRRRADEITDRALDWLRAPRRGPFLLWVHYYDVHAPRRPPPPYDAIPDAYDGALAYVDAEVGRLLDGVAQAAGERPTLTIVTGDHGESLGEHDELTHGMLVYDATLHVPLVVAGPGFPAGTRSTALSATADVAPTILAAGGAALFPEASGHPLQTKRTPAADDATVGYFECLGPAYRLGWARLGGVRTPRWKLTAEPEPIELYDTRADPGEMVNRAADEPAVVAELTAAWMRVRPAPDQEMQTPRPAATIEEQLAALGYLDVAPAAPAGAAPDPRRFVAATQLIDAATTRAAEGAIGPAVAALEALATSPVVRPIVLSTLAQIHLATDHPADAARVARALVELTGSAEARLTLARAQLESGQPTAALTTLDAAAAAGGTSRRARQLRVLILLELGRVDDAVALAETGTETDDAATALVARTRAARDGAAAEIPRLEALVAGTPDATRLVDTRAVLAGLLRQEGRDADAVRTLDVPAAPPAHRVMLAEIAADHGNPVRAAALLEAVVIEQPGVSRYRRQLADLYGTLDRPADALAQYDVLVAGDPGNAGLLVDRGVTRAALGQWGDATADYQEALALDEALPEAHLNLALAELIAGRDADAEVHLLRAVALRPDYRKAHFHLARLYGKRGDARGALHAEQAAGAPKSPGID
ncbi:MAG TPA: sulfatase-like hydrolase/transferase [Candidatus Binatia bacterium]|jgi:arylsulfatase A-like enzyme/Flp pilus assembly protein TadD|nr:sulfatase-like hydrolase/transferase [Candidatus Binatia bacterium]